MAFDIRSAVQHMQDIQQAPAQRREQRQREKLNEQAIMSNEMAQAFQKRKQKYDMDRMEAERAELERIQNAGSNIDELDQIKDAIRIAQATGDHKILGTIEYSDPRLGQLAGAVLRGEEKAVSAFDQIYARTYDRAARYGLREAKQSLPQKVEAVRNKDTGEIQYVDINNPSNWDKFEPVTASATQRDMKPAIDRKTGEVVLADWNDSKFNDKYRVLPSKSGTAVSSDGRVIAVDPEPSLSKAEEAVDKEFAKEYVKWKTGGGMAKIQSNMSVLSGVQSDLESGDQDLTGGWLGYNLTPDVLIATFNPDALNTREKVEEVVQSSLKEILGTQFTENEGERIVARAYNPKLEEYENAGRVRKLLSEIFRAAEAKDSASRYYEEYGTLKGWQGDQLNAEYFMNLDFDNPVGGDEWGVK